ncbi:MAG: hypothetical protein QXO47_01180 [Thermoproteota archaeon]
MRGEGWRPFFVFFLCVTLAISVATPLVNCFGVESTDFLVSGAAFSVNVLKNGLLYSYGVCKSKMEKVQAFSTVKNDVVIRFGGLF